MTRIALDDLIGAISQSAHQAQRTLSFAHLGHLASYFEPSSEGHLEARKVKILLPRDHIEDGQEAEAVHEIPYAALTDIRPLELEQIELELECVVEGLDEPRDEGEPRLSVRLGPPRDATDKPGRLTLHFSHGEVPEGVARINDKLLKTF